MQYPEQCGRCKAGVPRNGMTNHYKSERCNDRLQAFQQGFDSAKERIGNLIDMQEAK